MSDAVPDESTNHADCEPQQAAPARSLRDTSGPAIAATAALVLFSVFIGVFGPRIGNRQQVPLGVTLVELAEAVVSRSQPQFVVARSPSATEMTEQDFEAQLDDLTGNGVALPSLEALRLAAVSVQRVRLPGGRGGLAVLRSTDPREPRLAAVAVIEDEGMVTVYDRFSRPVVMPKGEVFSITDSNSDPPSVVEVYREGEFIVAVHAMSREFARELISAMQVAGAARTARIAEQSEGEPAPGRGAEQRP